MVDLPAVTLSHSKDDFVAAAADGYTSNFVSKGLKCMEPAHIQRGSAEGAETQTQPQRKDEESTGENSKRASDEDDEEITTDEYGCPDLTKETFLCSWCGGKDGNGKCKGVSGIEAHQ